MALESTLAGITLGLRPSPFLNWDPCFPLSDLCERCGHILCAPICNLIRGFRQTKDRRPTRFYKDLNAVTFSTINRKPSLGH